MGWVRTGSFNIGTGIAGSTVSVTGLSLPSEAQLLILSLSRRTESVDTVGRSNYQFSYGFGIGQTQRYCISVQSEDNSADSDTDRVTYSDAIIATLDIAGTDSGKADFDSFLTDGFRLIIDTQFAVSNRISYTLIGGLENVTVGEITSPAGTGNQDIALSFQPDGAILITTQQTLNTIATTSAFSVGAIAANNNAVIANLSVNGAASSDTASYCLDGECVGLFTSTTAMAARAVGSLITNAIRLNWTEASAGAVIPYVAWKGLQTYIGTFSTQTDTTTPITITGVPFTPLGGQVFSHEAVENATDTPTANAIIAFGVFTSISNRFCYSSLDVDAQATTVCDSAIEFDEVLVYTTGAGTLHALMDVSSINSDGVTFIMDDADNINRFGWTLLFGSEIPLPLRPQNSYQAASSTRFERSEYKQLGFVNNLLETTLLSQDNVIRNRQEFPSFLPGKLPALTWINNSLDVLGLLTTPFNQLDWSNLKLKGENNKGFINNNLSDVLAPEEAFLLRQSDWPNPLIGGKQNIGSVQGSTLYIPEPEEIQNTQRDWPYPLRKKRPNVGWIDYYALQNLNINPVGKQNYPIRIERKRTGRDWIQMRPQFYEDIKPFKQDAWPNPELKFKPAITFIHNRKIDEPPTPEPFKVSLYPNPLIKERLRIDWNDRFSIVRQDVRPDGRGFTDIPLPRLREQVSTWLNTRPFYYEEPPVIVFRQNSWPNPVIRKRVTETIVINRLTEIPTNPIPHHQTEWPLPLRKRTSQGWIDYYTFDENLPFVSQISFVPRGKNKFTPTWINSGILITDAGTPIIPYDYPNPIILKQQTKGWIDNLLQNNLDPGTGEKPFNQNDYPNPIIGLKNFHNGWLDGRKYYFEEPPLQIGQFDWPVFRSLKRNDVGFIDFKIGSSDPIFTTLDFVPVVRLKKGNDWIYSSLINLIEIQGLKPFSQLDWPIFRRIYNYDLYNFFRVYNDLPPNIIGRIICLDAALIEYNLEAALEEYDLNAKMIIYGLDAGGADCE